jgi:hypothetical protein
MARQPGQHFGIFVGGVVVEDDMNQLASRDSALDGIEKADEFDVATVLHYVFINHRCTNLFPDGFAPLGYPLEETDGQ